jgi:DNA-binding transcriptional MerR regulator
VLKISEFAALAQVSVRLLHHYDRIGLLHPARVEPSSGYRYYSIDQLPRLNRILALRDLGLSLEQVGEMLRETVSAEEIRAMLTRRHAELRHQIARDQARLAEAEMRLNTIEREGQLPRYDVITKRIAPEHAVTGTLTMPEGRNLVMFYEAGRLAIRASPMRGKIAAVIGIYPRPFVIERTPRLPFTFQPAYAVAPEDAVPITIEGYETLEPGTLPGYALAASTMHDAPYNQLFGAHTALLRWAEANGLRPLGMIREVYLRDGNGERPPLVEVQMPLTG